MPDASNHPAHDHAQHTTGEWIYFELEPLPAPLLPDTAPPGPLVVPEPAVPLDVSDDDEPEDGRVEPDELLGLLDELELLGLLEEELPEPDVP